MMFINRYAIEVLIKGKPSVKCFVDSENLLRAVVKDDKTLFVRQATRQEQSIYKKRSS